MAAAARNTAKFFEDNRRELSGLASDVARLDAATRDAFTGGWSRGVARSLGIFNPDLGVLMVRSIPVATNVTLAFFTGAQVPGPDNVQEAGRVIHDLAVGVGQMIAIMGAAETPHQAPAADLDAAWTWGDGVSLDCYASAFSGDIPCAFVPLMLMLQGAATTAVLVARTDCCPDCQIASFKHRLVVAHHLARSLEKLTAAGLLSAAPMTRVKELLADAAVVDVLRLRALRNGLVHLGLSDVPSRAFDSPDPFGAVVEYYTMGRTLLDVNESVGLALHRLAQVLTEWLLTPSLGARGFVELLRPPS